jgi:hypothetical protein
MHDAVDEKVLLLLGQDRESDESEGDAVFMHMRSGLLSWCSELEPEQASPDTAWEAE